MRAAGFHALFEESTGVLDDVVTVLDQRAGDRGNRRDVAGHGHGGDEKAGQGDASPDLD